MLLLRKILSLATGNIVAQKVLHTNILASQFLMGIGAGGGVASSGEKSVFRFLAEQTDARKCIFDVGANKGQFLRLLLNNLENDQVSVHSFEPGKHTFSELAASVPDNPNVVLNNVGISNKKGDATLHSNQDGSGLASLTKRRLDHVSIPFENTETVSLTTIDDYCQENNIDNIDLLKIDIEGHELDALAGAQNMFEAQAIRMVTFEFGGCNIDTGTYFRDFWYFFQELNMDIFRITPGGCFYPIQAYNEALEQFKTMNFIAVSKRSAAIKNKRAAA